MVQRPVTTSKLGRRPDADLDVAAGRADGRGDIQTLGDAGCNGGCGFVPLSSANNTEEGWGLKRFKKNKN